MGKIYCLFIWRRSDIFALVLEVLNSMEDVAHIYNTTHKDLMHMQGNERQAVCLRETHSRRIFKAIEEKFIRVRSWRIRNI